MLSKQKCSVHSFLNSKMPRLLNATISENNANICAHKRENMLGIPNDKVKMPKSFSAPADVEQCRNRELLVILMLMLVCIA